MVLHLLALTVNASEVTKPGCQQRYMQAPHQGQRCITDTEIYINYTGIQRHHHCTWLCMRDQNCQVINFNSIGAYCLLSNGPCVSLEKEADFVTTSLAAKGPCSKWVENYENDTYKTITFPKGTNTSDLLIVVRGRVGNNKVPGKGSLNSGYKLISWEGQEMTTHFTYFPVEFLTISPECTISWVLHDSTSRNPLPAGAVIGGNLNDVPLYVARKSTVHMAGFPTMYSCGYYNNIDGRGHMPYGGLDLLYTDVEILVIQG